MWYEWALVSEGISASFIILRIGADKNVQSFLHSTQKWVKDEAFWLVIACPPSPKHHTIPINTLHALHTWRLNPQYAGAARYLPFVEKIWSGQIPALGEAVTRWFVLWFLSWGCKLMQIWVSQFSYCVDVASCWQVLRYVVGSDTNVIWTSNSHELDLVFEELPLSLLSDYCKIRAYRDRHHFFRQFFAVQNEQRSMWMSNDQSPHSPWLGLERVVSTRHFRGEISVSPNFITAELE